MKQKNQIKSEYNGSSIGVLEGIEAVRVRPGMYIGSTNYKGLHHLIYEIIDNSIDEHLAGYCSIIDVIMNKNGSITITDNGRGIPVDLNPKKGISAERVIFTTLHAGGKFGGGGYGISGGLHGVGSSVVNALSKRVEVLVYRGGKIYKDVYIDGGIPVVELKDGLLEPIDICDINKTGTSVTFTPDDTIFETVEFRADIIKARLKELAYLNKGLTINFRDEIRDENIVFHEKEGIKEYVKYLNKDSCVLHEDVIEIMGTSQEIEVHLAFQYTDKNNEQIISFCNDIATIEGGTHETGFKIALTRLMNKYGKQLKIKDAVFEGRDVRSGLTAICCIKHRNPQYEGQTKTKLGNSDAKNAVADVLYQEGEKFFDRHVELLNIVMDNCMKSLSQRQAQENINNKNMKKAMATPIKDKLASCTSKKKEECEIYIVEGDSAGGSAKQGRDRRFQAILPLKGKIMNILKNIMEKVLNSQSIVTLVTALEAGFGEEFNIKKLRYNRIIIMTDADVDGAHIRTLLLTFFFKYMRQLIEEGHIYIAQPPLYKISKGKKEYYVYSDNELEVLLKKIGDNVSIQRYKGLGEMNPEQLWETTMNPETRILYQVTLEDAEEAEELTNLLMGDIVEPRKQFIFEESKKAVIDI